MFRKIQHKLIYYFLLIGILPLSITMYAEYKSMSTTLREKSLEHLTSVRESRKKSIEQYFSQVKHNVHYFSIMTKDIYKDFQRAFLETPQEPISQNAIIALKKYYASKLVPVLQGTENMIRSTLEQYYPKNSRTRQFQSFFFLKNETTVSLSNRYFRTYEEVIRRHHERLEHFKNLYGYHNLMLIDAATGYVVYSTRKELDFAVCLQDEPYAQEEIGRIFKHVRSMTKDNAKVLLTDFVSYVPHRCQPILFVAAPIFDKTENIGVVIVQLSADRINEIMTSGQNWETDGLGKTGECFLVGSDKLLRSDLRLFKENPAVFLNNTRKRNTFTNLYHIKIHRTNVLFYEVNTPDVEMALSGRTETRLIDNQQSTPMLISYAPLSVEGLKWVLIARIDAEEAFAPVEKLSQRFVALLTLAFVCVMVTAILIARSFSQPLQTLLKGIKELKAGNWSVRLPVRSKDEIGILTQSFNETIQTLQATNEAMLQTNQLLLNKNNEIAQKKAEIDQKHEELMRFAQEISQTNQQLEATRAEQQKFVAMAENSSDLIVMFDFNGKLLYVNPAGKIMLGIKHDANVQQFTIADLFKLTKNNTIIDRILSDVKRQGFLKQEMEIYHLISGNVIQVEILSFVITDQHKLLCLAAMMRDIRERKKVERELKEYSERLAKINKDLEEKQRLNEQQSEELRRSHEELLKKNQDLALQRDSIAAKNREIVLTIEQLNQTIQRLNATQVQLVEAEKMASLGQLTAGIAHEINNPINFISGNIEPLRLNIDDLKKLIQTIHQVKSLDDLETVKKVEEEIQLPLLLQELDSMLDGIAEGVRRTREIVVGLRNFSRLDQHELTHANINEGIHSTIILLKSKLKSAGIELVENYDLSMPLIACYAGKLNQAFMNILSNAIYAIEKAKKNSLCEKGIITVRTLQTEREVVVRITDNGIGMSKKVMKRIFEPFFTTKEVGEGTGLGLSITHGVVQQHHGKIEVTSEEGKGTTFTIRIPKNLEELVKASEEKKQHFEEFND